MRLWKEFKRLISLDLHSYWEVFYLDVIVFISSGLFVFPFARFLNWLGLLRPYAELVRNNIHTPAENYLVKLIAPAGLDESTYHKITAGVVFIFCYVNIHLCLCALVHLTRAMRDRQIEISVVEQNGPSPPQFTRIDSKEEEKKSFWHRTKNELTRILKLDLHSCWEVFYLDAILAVFTFILSGIVTSILNYFRVPASILDPVMNYVEKPLENAVIRAVAPAGLTDSSYQIITLMVLIALEFIFFHSMATYFYLKSRKQQQKLPQTVDDVEGNNGCFSRMKVAPKEEKERPLHKVYQSVYTLSSSSLYLSRSTDKLLEKTVFP